MDPILIFDEVRTTITGHVYFGATGVVIATKAIADTEDLEHLVRFPPRTFTPEEIDRGEDLIPQENQVWFQASEIEKA